MTNPLIGSSVSRFQFSYATPTLQDDGQGGQTTVNVPTTFALAGISLDVAKGMLRGLLTVPTIINPTVTRFRDATDTVTGGTLL